MLTIEYDGSEFSGWQRQPDRTTVQGTLEEVLSRAMGREVLINGTSRTDAGVHALGQRASFKGDFGIPTEKIKPVVNSLLAGRSGGIAKMGRVGAIRIVDVEEKDPEFHARFDSRGKMYRYIIRNIDYVDIFSRKYSYQITEPLDVDAMNEAAAYIVGTHDFACFQAAGGNERETTVRTIYSLDVKRQGENVILEVSGDGFLYNMVRIITGTLVEVGLGIKKAAELEEIVAGADRRKAGHTAPPNGLYLVEVYY